MKTKTKWMIGLLIWTLICVGLYSLWGYRVALPAIFLGSLFVGTFMPIENEDKPKPSPLALSKKQLITLHLRH